VTERITVLPSARRLMDSLRDIGYDLPAAVADLVDNSIDAGASTVDVTIASQGPDSWVRVADNGFGMTPPGLDEAMRYGSVSAYSDRALGHFGLGLKTGSLSQCRRLTVVSRRGPRGRLAARRWDLDDIAQLDAWELEAPAAGELSHQALHPLRGRGGTVVLWEKLDRVLAFRNPAGAPAAKALDGLARDVRAHLSMVFHRFLSGEWADGEARVEVTVNGETLHPWDPFVRSEPRTRVLPRQLIGLPVSDGPTVQMEVRPYVLPSQTHFSSASAHQDAAGPNRWNRQQGLYIYRRQRLIQSGGWNRLRTLDEHAKLARIAVDLPISHEELFGINVSKMSVSLPEAARPPLRTIASAVVQEAQRSYREHLHQAVPPAPSIRVPDHPEDPPQDQMGEGPSIAGDWPLILRSVTDALSDDPRARDRVLLSLANAVG